jgi:hypothetical protein
MVPLAIVQAAWVDPGRASPVNGGNFGPVDGTKTSSRHRAAVSFGFAAEKRSSLAPLHRGTFEGDRLLAVYCPVRFLVDGLVVWPAPVYKPLDRLE